jgi:hypothetical protein
MAYPLTVCAVRCLCQRFKAKSDWTVTLYARKSKSDRCDFSWVLSWDRLSDAQKSILIRNYLFLTIWSLNLFLVPQLRPRLRLQCNSRTSRLSHEAIREKQRKRLSSMYFHLYNSRADDCEKWWNECSLVRFISRWTFESALEQFQLPKRCDICTKWFSEIRGITWLPFWANKKRRIPHPINATPNRIVPISWPPVQIHSLISLERSMTHWSHNKKDFCLSCVANAAPLSESQKTNTSAMMLQWTEKQS